MVLPLLFISRYARTNFVDYRLTDQMSIIRFIEGDWNAGRMGEPSFDECAGASSTSASQYW